MAYISKLIAKGISKASVRQTHLTAAMDCISLQVAAVRICSLKMSDKGVKEMRPGVIAERQKN